MFITKFTKEQENFNDLKFKLPDIQRMINDDFVNTIYNFQVDFYNSNQHYCLLNTISICKVKILNHQYLIDGQHRIMAYSKLRCTFPERSIHLTVDNYECETLQDMERIFELVNMNHPLKCLKLGIDKYKIYNDFTKLFTHTFKCYLSKSLTPYKPNISIESMIDQFTSKNFIEICKIETGLQIYNLILSLNQFYSNVDKKLFGKNEWQVVTSQTHIDKINNHPNKLYIGLYTNYEWIDRLLEHISFNIPFTSLKHISTTFRPKITAHLKRKCWEFSNHTKIDGTCFCCTADIAFDKFVIGHIIPVSLGGETTLQNVRAICELCNKDMGTENMIIYKDRLNVQLNI